MLKTPLLLLLLLLPQTNAQGSYSNTSGVITSPNYPALYDNELHSVYNILIPQGYYVHLVFYEFITEGCCDVVYAFDGPDANSPPIKNLSGQQTGQNLSSTGNALTLVFITDIDGQERGFYGEYNSVPLNTPLQANTNCPATVYTDTFGVIYSPNFPSDYPNNAFCTYLLGNSLGRISLTFYAIDTEGCCDLIKIYDGSSSNAPLLGTVSGLVTDLKTFNSTGSSLFVVFSTDLQNTFTGFSAGYIHI